MAEEIRTEGPQIHDILFDLCTTRNNIVGDVPPPEKNLVPIFHFTMAVTEKAGSSKRKIEEEELKKTRANFLKCVNKIYPNISDHDNTEPVVDSYEQMIQKIQTFLQSVKVSNLPIIVFLGHGESDGKLRFSNESGPHVKEAFEDIRKCFEKERPADIPSWQLRVVFSQCYAHLIDDSNQTPGKVRFDRIEYICFTTPSSPKIIDEATWTQCILQLKMLDTHTDVDLEPIFSDDFFTSAVDQLRKDLAGEPEFTEYTDEQIKYFIIHGPDHRQILSEEIRNKLQQQHKKMRKCLNIISPSTDQLKLLNHLTKLSRQLSITVDDNKMVQSEEEFHETITSFLTGDVYMPVIMVTGDCEINDKRQLMLNIGQNIQVNAQRTLYDHHKENPNLRLIFIYHNGTSVSLWTNALPRKVLDCEMEMLNKKARVIIGDSQHNKTGIQVPESTSVTSLEEANVRTQESGHHQESTPGISPEAASSRQEDEHQQETTSSSEETSMTPKEEEKKKKKKKKKKRYHLRNT